MYIVCVNSEILTIKLPLRDFRVCKTLLKHTRMYNYVINGPRGS